MEAQSFHPRARAFLLDLSCVAVVLLPIGIVLGDVITGTRHLIFPGDTSELLYPLEVSIARYVKSGVIPLWHPHDLAGMPLAGYPQYGLFYPLNLLFWLWPYGDQSYPIEAYHARFVLHVILAATGMYFLARTLRLSRVAGMTAATIFALMPTALAFAPWGNSQVAFSWWPWTLGFALRASSSGSRVPVAVAAGCLGVTILGSPAQPAIQLILALSLLFVFEGWHAYSRQGARLLRALVTRYLIIIVGGILIGSITLLPVAEYASYSLRYLGGGQGAVLTKEAIPIEASIRNSFRLEHVPGFIDITRNQGGLGTNFFGAFALVLAVVGLAGSRPGQRRHAFYFGALALLSGLYMFGIVIPYLFSELPGLNLIREPQRYAYLFGFSVAALAAFGVDRLVGVTWRRATALGILGASVLVGVLAVAVWKLQAITSWPTTLALAQVAIALALLGSAAFVAPRTRLRRAGVGLLVAGVFWTFSSMAVPSLGYNQFDPQRYFASQEQFARLTPDTAEPFRVFQWRSSPRRQQEGASFNPNIGDLTAAYTTWGYHNPTLAQINRAYNRSYKSPIYSRLLNARYFVTDRVGARQLASLYRRPLAELAGFPGVVTRGRGLSFATSNLLALEHPPPLPAHAWVTSEYSVLRRAGASKPPFRSDPTRAVIESPGFDPAERTWLARVPRLPDGSVVPHGFAPVPSTIAWEEYDANHFTLRVQRNKPGLLVVSELFYPGWTATVNGKSADVVRANWLLRGVAVPSGASTVTFRYRPVSLAIGAVLSALTFVGLISYVLCYRRPHVRRT